MLYVMLHIIGAVTRCHVAGECTLSGVPPVHMNHSETGASWRSSQTVIPEVQYTGISISLPLCLSLPHIGEYLMVFI